MLGLSTRALALGAAAVALGIDAVYLVAVGLEDGGEAGVRVALVVGTLAAAGVLAAAAAFARGPSLPLVLLSAAGSILVFWGVLSLTSIGIPLLVGGFLAAAAAMQAAEEAPPDAFRGAIAAAIGIVGALAIGYALG